MPRLTTHRSWPWSEWRRKRRLRHVAPPSGDSPIDLGEHSMTWRENARLHSATATALALVQQDIRRTGRAAERLRFKSPELRRAFHLQAQLGREIDEVATQKEVLDQAFAEEGRMTRRGRVAPRSVKWLLIGLIGVIEVLAIKTPLLVAYDIDAGKWWGQIESWLVPMLSMGIVFAAAEFGERRKHLADTHGLADDEVERVHALHRGRESWAWLGVACGLLFTASALRIGISQNVALEDWSAVLAAIVPLGGLVLSVAVEYRLANAQLDRRDGLDREEHRLRRRMRRPLRIESRYRKLWQRLVNRREIDARAVDFQFEVALVEIAAARGAQPDVFGLAAAQLPDLATVTQKAVLIDRPFDEAWLNVQDLDPDAIRATSTALPGDEDDSATSSPDEDELSAQPGPSDFEPAEKATAEESEIATVDEAESVRDDLDLISVDVSSNGTGAHQ